TTGLHFEDIRKLLVVLNRLVEKGNTVITIEHNLDDIKSADWNVDLGLEGGSSGGQIVPRVHRNKWHKSEAVIPVDSWRRRYTHNVVESVSPRVHQYCLVQAGRKIMAIGETGVVRTGVRSLLRFGARPKTSGFENIPETGG